MNWEKLLSDLRMGESEKVVFLPKITSDDDLGPLMVAMINTNGGRIYIGLDTNNFHLLGTEFDTNLANEICERHCLPYFQVTATKITKSGKDILCITVPEGTTKPYYYKNNCYIMENNKPTLAKHAQQPKQTKPTEKETVIKPFPEQEDVTTTQASSNTDPEITQIITEIQTEITEINEMNQEKKQEQSIDQSPKAKTEATPKQTPPSSDNNLNQRQTNALKYLENNKAIKNKLYREMYNISHKTAHLELADLVDKNLLKVKGSGRSTSYVLVKS